MKSTKYIPYNKCECTFSLPQKTLVKVLRVSTNCVKTALNTFRRNLRQTLNSHASHHNFPSPRPTPSPSLCDQKGRKSFDPHIHSNHRQTLFHPQHFFCQPATLRWLITNPSIQRILYYETRKIIVTEKNFLSTIWCY